MQPWGGLELAGSLGGNLSLHECGGGGGAVTREYRLGAL